LVVLALNTIKVDIHDIWVKQIMNIDIDVYRNKYMKRSSPDIQRKQLSNILQCSHDDITEILLKVALSTIIINIDTILF
jgi:hypothetical protein